MGLSPCTLALVTILFSSYQIPAAALPKILCLHGGGQTASGFQAQLSDLTEALSSQYEFLFPQGPVSGSLWVKDPPGGKGAPTTDADWASSSVAMLDDYLIGRQRTLRRNPRLLARLNVRDLLPLTGTGRHILFRCLVLWVSANDAHRAPQQHQCPGPFRRHTCARLHGRQRLGHHKLTDRWSSS